MRPGFTTLILNAKFNVWHGNAFSPPPRKFCILASAGKVMATVFWDAEGIVLIDYLEHGSTITETYYTDLIEKVRAALKDKRRGKLRRGVLIHQDNAILMPLDRGRFAVVHPCSTFWDWCQLVTPLNAEVQNRQKTAKIGVFRRQRTTE